MDLCQSLQGFLFLSMEKLLDIHQSHISTDRNFNPPMSHSKGRKDK